MAPPVDDVVSVDGRTVAFCVYHPAASQRVVFEYGTPGLRLLSPPMIAAAERAGCALLVVDRPGYGGSTRRPGRQVVDVVADVAAVLDALGWPSCAVWGGSGGGPHALALGARLGSRVTRCASVVGLAPFDAPGLDWFEGMSPGNVAEFRAACSGPSAYGPLVQRLADEAVAELEGGGVQVAEGYELPEADRVALVARRSEAGYLERMRATYAGGVDGWTDDGVAFTRPWGFALSEIGVPASVWYGAQDVLASRDHPEHLIAAIPGAERHELAGGHVLADADLDAIYTWLTA